MSPANRKIGEMSIGLMILPQANQNISSQSITMIMIVSTQLRKTGLMNKKSTNCQQHIIQTIRRRVLQNKRMHPAKKLNPKRLTAILVPSMGHTITHRTYMSFQQNKPKQPQKKTFPEECLLIIILIFLMNQVVTRN